MTPSSAATLRLRRTPTLRARAVRGDAQAFAVLYERHHQELYRYARSILQHDEDARDALQSAMARAFAALQGERRDFEVRPWLFRIVHNETISLIRRRRPTTELEDAREIGTDDLERTVETRERLRVLQEDLRELTERQRAALVLRELSGLGHEEIAEVLETSPRAVKQTIYEARVALGELAEGRAMECAEVQRRLSDGDGRALRGRKMAAHLRACPSCGRFKLALAQRPADLGALAPPLPLAAGAGILATVLPGGGGAAGGAVAAGGAAAGGAAAGGLLGGLSLGGGAKLALLLTAGATAAGGVALTEHRHERPAAPPPAFRDRPPVEAVPVALRAGAPATSAVPASPFGVPAPATAGPGAAGPIARSALGARSAHGVAVQAGPLASILTPHLLPSAVPGPPAAAGAAADAHRHGKPAHAARGDGQGASAATPARRDAPAASAAGGGRPASSPFATTVPARRPAAGGRGGTGAGRGSTSHDGSSTATRGGASRTGAGRPTAAARPAGGGASGGRRATSSGSARHGGSSGAGAGASRSGSTSSRSGNGSSRSGNGSSRSGSSSSRAGGNSSRSGSSSRSSGSTGGPRGSSGAAPRSGAGRRSLGAVQPISVRAPAGPTPSRRAPAAARPSGAPAGAPRDSRPAAGPTPGQASGRR